MIVIGPRRSGKTSKLIKDVIEYLELEFPGGEAHVVSNSPEELKNKFSAHYLAENRISFGNSMEKKVKNFVDEFDLIDEDKLFISRTSNYYGRLKGKYQSTFFQELLEETKENF